MTPLTDLLRTALAAVLLAVALAFGALAATGTPSGSTSDDAARPFVYYKCYVKGYGWMYCTDSAHA